MTMLSILALSAASTLRRDVAHAFPESAAFPPPPRTRTRAPREQVCVTVAASDALHVRRALVGCAGAAIARCLPLPVEDKVQLEISYPAGQGAAVIARVLRAVPQGLIGSTRHES